MFTRTHQGKLRSYIVG